MSSDVVLSNQPPLHASKFLSFFSDAAARDAEAHGHPHVPEPTYLVLLPEVCLPFSKIRDIVRGQVANLEKQMLLSTCTLHVGPRAPKSCPAIWDADRWGYPDEIDLASGL